MSEEMACKKPCIATWCHWCIDGACTDVIPCESRVTTEGGE